MHRKPFQRIAAVVLLLVLVAAEALAVVHSVDLDAHASGDSCKICLVAAGLGTAAPAKAPPSELPRTYAPVGVAHEIPVPFLRAERPSARGPPLVS